MPIRIKLLKSWKHPYRNKPYAVGTILQCGSVLASDLLADKIGEIYNGEYPPKEKSKIELKQLKTK